METQLTSFEALQLAAETAGSQSALARICGVSQTAVWKWLQSSKRLPAEHVLVVEAETGISRHLLRPDIYPARPGLHIETPVAPKRPVGRRGSTVPCDRKKILQAGNDQ